jgi:hypothetical protein
MIRLSACNNVQGIAIVLSRFLSVRKGCWLASNYRKEK